MTRKQIDNLTLDAAMKIYIEKGHKVTFDTKDEDVRAIAREYLRKEKVLANHQSS